jgi:zinc/manganese transport system permease protein
MTMLLEAWWLLPLLVAGLCGLVCPLLGTLLVVQQRVLSTNLMAYAVLPGVVVAKALGWPVLLGGMGGAMAAVLLAELLMAERPAGSGQPEAVLNTVLASCLAVGVLLIQALELPVDLDGLLFGDLLVAGPADLLRLLVALALVLLVLRLRFQQLQWLGLDPEGAEALELPLRGLRLAMAALTALVVVSATAAVGLALVMALICAPSLAGLAGARSHPQALGRASGLGLAIALAGCSLALGLNQPPGPLIACCCLVVLVGHRHPRPGT